MPFKTNERGLYVWIPEEEPPRWKCTVITACDDEGEKTYCNTPFWDHRQYQHHVTACATRHANEIRKSSLRERMPAFFSPTEAGIVDLEQWFEKRDAAGESNRQKVIDGRLKM